MEIDAALVGRIGVLEIVGEARDRGKVMTAGRMEVGISATTLDRAMADSDIGSRFAS